MVDLISVTEEKFALIVEAKRAGCDTVSAVDEGYERQQW